MMTQEKMMDNEEMNDELANRVQDDQSLVDELINSVVDQDFAKSAPTFAEIMRTKMDDAIEQEKISVADTIFNGAEEDGEDVAEDEDDDITDEELDDALADVEEEDEAA